MAIDSRFIVTSDLEELFRDKDSGEPLAGGIITFYSDLNRSTKKPVYQLTGSPPNYTYAALPNPSVLSDVGTFQDALGNNIVPYYFPYEGTPDDDNTTVELYYITVESSGGVPQFTREGWPNFSGDGSSSSALDDHNFIPNGQFLAHNDIVSATEPPVSTIAFGSVNLSSQAIAQGGWSFRRSSGGSSVFDNSFERISTAVAGLDDFPRYAFNFASTTFNANDTVRDLTISWPNVNTFSAGDTPGTQDYTFYFSAMSNNGNTYNFEIYLIQYFGTGGSPSDPIQTLLSTVSVSPGYSSYTVHIAGFPASAGTLGDNDDDYVAIAIRGPATTWDAQFTDFALLFGNVSPTAFPVQTNAEQLSDGVAGWMPTPASNGSDLYLPLILTPSGMIFDDSQIGTITAKMAVDSVEYNELLCDGSMYITANYSAIGIPYSRLQEKIYQSGGGIELPLFGTGEDYAQAYIPSGQQTDIILCTNKLGAQTHPADGTTSCGFTFAPVTESINPGSPGYNYSSGSNGDAVVVFIGDFTTGTNGGASFAAGTSGMTFTDYSDPSITGIHYIATTTAHTAAALAAGAGNPGEYFTFSDSGNDYYLWFKVSTETDPAPAGTAIKVGLASYMNANDVGNVIRCVLEGFQTNIIRAVAASSVTAGSWFTFFANAVKYVVWFENAGAGTEPVVASTQAYIKVTLTGSETAAEVASKVQIAINSYSFAVPDLRGTVLRGIESSAYWDLLQANRFTPQGVGSPENPGSLQTDLYATTGGTESRLVNVYTNFYIKY